VSNICKQFTAASAKTEQQEELEQDIPGAGLGHIHTHVWDNGNNNAKSICRRTRALTSQLGKQEA